MLGLKEQPGRLEDLLARLAGRDKQALSELYHQMKTIIYSFALSILKNKADAEDVMQETFIKIYAAAGSYRSQGKPEAWMLTIARNLCLMRLRENKKTGALSPEELLLADPCRPMENRLDQIMLDAALNTLSTEESQIVILHALVGFKHREIADFLGLGLSTTLSKYRRALKKLQKELKEDALNDGTKSAEQA